MPKKRCGTCQAEKPTSDFGKNRAKPDGLQSSCNPCRKKVNASYYRRSKEKFNPIRQERLRKARAESRRRLAEYLLDHPCVDCGESDIVVLQFDHRSDNKVADVGTMVADGLTWSRIAAEIAKCDVVCANDHSRRTAAFFGWYKATLNPR
jgi:hypothetical protein